jgi:hypothetical protein
MITMILALAADLLVLPVMLRWYNPKPRAATQSDAAQTCHSPGTPFNA